MHEQRPGHLADLEPLRRQHPLAVAPGTAFIAAEALAERPAETARVAAIALPRRQPCAQLLIALEHGPVHQPLRDLAGRVDDERQIASRPDAMDAAFVVAAVMDAGRAETRPDCQCRDRVAGLMPGRPDGCLPGRPEAGIAAAVVALPDPSVVHDGLVVVADDPAQLGLDRGQDTRLGWLHDQQASLPASGRRGAARPFTWTHGARAATMRCLPAIVRPTTKLKGGHRCRWRSSGCTWRTCAGPMADNGRCTASWSPTPAARRWWIPASAALTRCSATGAWSTARPQTRSPSWT